MIIVIISGLCFLPIVVISSSLARRKKYKAGLLPYLTAQKNYSLFYSPWILETVTIKMINKKALIIAEIFD